MEKDFELIDILGNFKELGIKHGFFLDTTLGAIKHSCVPTSKLPVIDYDETARVLYEECLKSTLNKPQSCDALRFNETSYDFIEMKSLDNLFKHRFEENKDSFLQKDFTDKFTGSLKLMDNLLDFTNFQLTKDHIKRIKQAVGYYFVLVDVEFNYNDNSCENNEEFHAIMNFLSEGYQDNYPPGVSEFCDEFSATLEGQFTDCNTYLPSLQTKLITPNELHKHYFI